MILRGRFGSISLEHSKGRHRYPIHSVIKAGLAPFPRKGLPFFFARSDCAALKRRRIMEGLTEPSPTMGRPSWPAFFVLRFGLRTADSTD